MQNLFKMMLLNSLVIQYIATKLNKIFAEQYVRKFLQTSPPMSPLEALKYFVCLICFYLIFIHL